MTGGPDATRAAPPATPPPTPRTRWTGRPWAIALAVIGLVAGVAMVVLGVQAFSDAQALDDQADEALARQETLEDELAGITADVEAAQSEADATAGDVAALEDAVSAVVEASDELLVAVDAATSAQIAMVEASGVAVGLWNDGDSDGGREAVRTQVQPATAQFRARTQDLTDQVDQLRAAIAGLEEALS